MMSRLSHISLILLRIGAGWIFIYMGINALITNTWSLVTYTKGSILFPSFYKVVTDPTLVPYLNYAMKGLLIIVGAALILGIFVRIASLIGILIMLFFYFPIFKDGHIGTEYYIVNQHVIMILVLFNLFALRAGDYFAIGSLFHFRRHH
jgi:thiosulfate dehydrogenase [quinone] large subunit